MENLLNKCSLLAEAKDDFDTNVRSIMVLLCEVTSRSEYMNRDEDLLVCKLCALVIVF